MRAAFLPSARLESVGRSADIVDAGRLLPALQHSGRTRPCAARIDWLDITGTSAMAKVTLEHGAVTDYFVLLKTEAGWKIANKAFHAQPQ
jgi:hypothetical protein